MVRPAILAVLFAAPGFAQDAPDCGSPVTQTDLNQCAYANWQASDAELNEAYSAAMTAMEARDADASDQDAKGADVLRDAQRAWIDFRDLACEADGYPMKGGSAEPLLIYGCVLHLTIERTGQLRLLADSLGG